MTQRKDSTSPSFPSFTFDSDLGVCWHVADHCLLCFSLFYSPWFCFAADRRYYHTLPLMNRPCVHVSTMKPKHWRLLQRENHTLIKIGIKSTASGLPHKANCAHVRCIHCNWFALIRSSVAVPHVGRYLCGWTFQLFEQPIFASKGHTASSYQRALNFRAFKSSGLKTAASGQKKQTKQTNDPHFSCIEFFPYYFLV